MLLSRDQIPRILEPLRKLGKRIVFTNGCFDVLHVGHATYLSQARALGDALFLGLNSDQSVRALNKGPDRPIQSEKDRAELLLALKAVDYVSIFDEDTPLELIRIVKPQVLVKGGDWKPEQIVGAEFVQSLGGRAQSLPFVPGHSTTALLAKIKKL